MQHVETLRVGDILDGKYVVEALIGRGGMGSVFRARHIRLDSPRAIKLMRAELTDDEDFVRRFKNEALLAEGVRHPNVVALYDFATLDDGTRYIVWEYVEGETIRDLLDRGARFSSDEVRDLVAQIAEGLAAAHQKGVLHRDVSPDNVMVVPDEQGVRVAKLLDFGLAKAVGYPASVPSNPSVIFGKIGFASPEQMGLLGSDEAIDERTDIFSLAAVAYTMLTGRSPFVDRSLKAFLHDLMIAPEDGVRCRYLEGLPAPWREPLSRALSRDRANRPPTIEAFLEDIDDALRSDENRSATQKGHALIRPSRRRFYLSLGLGKRRFYLYLGIGIVLLSGSAFLTRRSITLGPMPGVRAPSVPPPFVPPPDASKQPPRESRPPREEEVEGPETRSVTASSSEPRPARATPPEEIPTKAIEPEPPAVLTEGSDLPSPDRGTEEPPAPSREDAPKTSDEESAPATASEPESENPPPVVEPRRIVYVPPVYPPIAVSSQTEGDVVLRVSIDRRGNVTVLGVERSASKLLERPAIEAVKQWKYAAMEAPMTFTVTVSFQLH